MKTDKQVSEILMQSFLGELVDHRKDEVAPR
ncbi:hypothetical protein LC2W_2249 [Lacticaseibacillus paracasei]|uniref:Uncharacterized protein n=1 Tax=Lacticaseibacillus paracasei subsp. paracasei Lpp126 TaxID=1256206 RepID=S2SHW8_LACPA|nr:hypothetical protein LC2W_2249 [Lacticaseibacillus paracasei]EPC83589.1 hypothetical protein Lpp37_03648 [Lacticaseibacillus paracasei subsp. paracasei Lpp37]EPC88884.1 hypothetical protein Lpp126_01299 [Lacticaseibacillus paracasei subsp. paracasei Lpp126]AEA57762.1 Hypothetical cytosolic protein [Lacticaseibacillus paracasei]ERN50241.1 hypothetical protein N422_03950 [Lacticaseibacillus paracasei]